MSIKKRGACGTAEVKKPIGGMLFNAAEMAAVSAAACCAAKITTSAVRAAVRKAGLSLRCSKIQLWDYASRHNKNACPGPQRGDQDIRIETLRTHIKEWIASQKPVAESALDECRVWNDITVPFIIEERVYIPIGCRGMGEVIKSAKHRYLKLVLDAKHKVPTNRWSILTLGFILCRQEVSTTSIRRHGQQISIGMHTSTMQPALQAIINAESKPNIKNAFEDLGALCDRFGEVDLKIMLVQVHKDYAKGIEQARRDVFPTVRVVEDYFHAKQAIENALPAKLTQVAFEVEEPEAERILIGSPVHSNA